MFRAVEVYFAWLRHSMPRACVTLTSMIATAALSWAAEGKPDLSKLPPASTARMDYVRDIQPIFAASCVKCHGSEKQKGGLRLDSGAETLKGGNAGVVLKAGDGVNSRLLQLVAGLDAEAKMPPNGKMLSTAEVGKIRAWIEQGAVVPKDAAAVTTVRARSTHWSFQPIVKPAVPKVSNSPWLRNDLDAFVLSRLEKERIAPSPEADRNTLIRRLYLDLLGLPPAPGDVDLFLNDSSPDAYEKLVERVLASPHYGERWGRHWLDLARYADSDGFEKDTGRPYAWRYRNWVIDALNRDLPFDQFTIEQLAGDLLPNATLDQKLATGFHRNTLTNKEGGVDQEQFRVEAVVDRVSTTAKVFMGITMACCQCHDHKYDPFSQREFYQFFAFFNSDVETDLAAPLPGEQEQYNQKKAEHDKKTKDLQASIAAYQQKELAAQQQKWENELKLPEVRKLPAKISAILLLEPEKRSAAQKKELADHYGKTDKKLDELNKALAAHQKTAPQLTKAMTLALGSTRKTNVMIRGDFLRKGVEVEPGTPGIFPVLPPSPKLSRLELAKWIVSPENPLTARVTANWVWHKFFGRGIVATLEDFGTQGEKPSHPELLDWLAAELLAPTASRGAAAKPWSLKTMHKLIVSSATYRQSSRTRPELVQRDPLNILLARQQRSRLEAEIIRDMALGASGLLTRTLGGPSVRPPQPSGISELTYAGSARWVESTGGDRYRRGMYTWFQRTSPYPMLLTFDAPDSNVCCVRRERSNTPLQALTLLNDTVFFECAQALGKRIIEEKSGSVQERIRHGVRLCVARDPSPRELERLSALYQELLSLAKSKPEAAAQLVGKTKPAPADLPEAAAWVAIARTLLNLDEFVTRE